MIYKDSDLFNKKSIWGILSRGDFAAWDFVIGDFVAGDFLRGLCSRVLLQCCLATNCSPAEISLNRLTQAIGNQVNNIFDQQSNSDRVKNMKILIITLLHFKKLSIYFLSKNIWKKCNSMMTHVWFMWIHFKVGFLEEGRWLSQSVCYGIFKKEILYLERKSVIREIFAITCQLTKQERVYHFSTAFGKEWMNECLKFNFHFLLYFTFLRWCLQLLEIIHPLEFLVVFL